jgi:hypothetical protein
LRRLSWLPLVFSRPTLAVMPRVRSLVMPWLMPMPSWLSCALLSLVFRASLRARLPLMAV